MAQLLRVRTPAVVALAAALIVLDAAPAAAHGAGGGGGPAEGDRRALAVGLAFAALAALAGPWLAGTARVDRLRCVVSRVAAIGAAAVATSIGLGRPAEVLVLAAAAALGAAPRWSPWRPLPAAALLALVSAGGSGPVVPLDRALGAVHLLAGAAWLGLVVELAVRWHRDAAEGGRLLRTASPRALLLLVAVAASGTLIAADHLGDARLALGSWWGRGLAVKVTAVAVAAAVGAALHRRWAPKLEGGLLVGVAAIGLALALAGGPLSGALPTGPFVAKDGAADVLVVPLAPGPNTVLVRATGRPRAGAVEVDGGPVALVERSDGLWAADVDLREGRHRIEVGGRTTSVTVRPAEGATVVTASLPQRIEDPDCFDRLAGYAAATARLTSQGRTVRLQVRRGGARCGLDGVDGRAVDWTGAGSSAVDALQKRRGGGPVLVVADDDPRARPLVAALRATGAPVRIVAPADRGAAEPAATDLVIVATRPPAAASAALTAVRGGGGTVPVLLAPWLLDGAVLTELADAGAPILVGTRRDPTAPGAVDYREASQRVTGGGWEPTAAGFEAYLAALEALAGVRSGEAVPGVFSVGRLAVLPPSLEEGHGAASGWAPGLAMARVG